MLLQIKTNLSVNLVYVYHVNYQSREKSCLNVNKIFHTSIQKIKKNVQVKTSST